MEKISSNFKHRLMAILLTVVMFFSMLPTSALFALAEETGVGTETGAQDGADTEDGADTQDGTDTEDGTDTQDGADTDDGTDTQDGTETETDEDEVKGKIDDVTIIFNLELVYSEDGMYTPITVSGTQDGDIVVYELKDSEGKEIIFSDDHQVEFSQVGEYPAKVTVSRVGCEDLVETGTVIVNNGEIVFGESDEENVGFTAATETETAQYSYVTTYTGDSLTLPKVKTNVDDVRLTYSYGDQSELTEMPIITNSGEYTITVTASRANYNDATATYKVTINQQEIEDKLFSDLIITPYSETYDGKSYAVAENTVAETSTSTLEEILEGYELEYSMQYDDTTDIWIDWTSEIPTITDAGSYAFKVRIVKEDDTNSNYTPYEIETTYTANIEKAEQSISFENSEESIETILGNESEFTVDVSNDSVYYGTDTNSIYYSIDTDNFIGKAEINEDGILTYTGVGKIKITAMLEEIDNYSSAKASKTIIIKALTDEDVNFISFENDTVDYTVGTNDGIVSEETADLFSFTVDEQEYTINPDITYSASDLDSYGLTIDAGTGAIEVQDYIKLIEQMETETVSIDVTAKIAESDYYSEYSTSYSITINFAEISNIEYIFTTNDEVIEGWYTSDVEVSVDGYELVQSITEDAKFDESLTFDTDGIYAGDNSQQTYLRAIDGGITSIQNIDDFKIDTTSPTNLDITVESTENASWNLEADTDTVYTNDGVQVAFTLDEDALSGVDRLEWKYTQTEGSSNDNLSGDSGNIYATSENEEDVCFTSYVDDEGTTKITATIVIDDDNIDGSISFVAYDKAGNESNTAFWQDGKLTILVIDQVSPTITVTHTNEDSNGSVPVKVDDTYYYDNDIKFTIEIAETNFNSDDFILKINGEKYLDNISWSEPNTDDIDLYEGTFTLEDDGSYVITIEYADQASNVIVDDENLNEDFGSTDDGIYTLNTVVIDEIKSTISISVDEAAQSVTFKVTETNFDASTITADITAKDIEGNDVADVAEELFTELSDQDNWELQEDTTNVYSFVKNDFEDANYKIENISIVDIAGLDSDPIASKEFTMDKTKPTEIDITYGELNFVQSIVETITFGFYNPSVEVTFTAYDATSGVNHFDWSYTQTSDSSNVNTISFDAVAEATQDKDDLTKFTATVELSAEDVEDLQYNGYISVSATDNSGIDNSGNTTDITSSSENIIIVDTISPEFTVTYSDSDRNYNEVAYYDNEVTVTFEIVEANFYEENIIVSVSKDGNAREIIDIEWNENIKVEDGYQGEITLPAAENSHDDDGNYVIYITYIDYAGNAATDETDYEETEVKLEDNTFEETTYEYASHLIVIDTTDPIIEVEYDIKAVDVIDEVNYYSAPATATVTIKEQNFISEEMEYTITAVDSFGNEISVDESSVELFDWSSDGDVHTMNITFSADAIYSFDVAYTDRAENAAVDYVTDYFAVDNTAPTDVTITYEESIVDYVLGLITFGFYNPSVDVTFTATESTSVVTKFSWEFIQEEGTSESNVDLENGVTDEVVYSQEDGTYSATITLTAAQESQYRGNIEVTATNNVGYISSIGGDEVGDIPTSDDVILVVDTISPTMSVAYTQADREVTTNEVSQYYYNNDVEVTFTINEANFYSEDVVVKVSKDGDEAYNVTPDWNDESVDIHNGIITLSGDGDYVIYVEYTDKSTNKMESYISDVHTIDEIIPVISFEYDADAQSTTYTITEHNFRSSEINVDVVAQDINSNDIDYTSFFAYLQNANNWSTVEGEEDVYTITYSDYSDAIYSIAINYTDLATNNAITKNTGKFIIDHTEPSTDDMSITYSTAWYSELLNKVTFGYYNPDVEVAFSSIDPISGVDFFTYDYTKINGSSDVNGISYEDVILNAVQDTTDKSLFTATITLPANEVEQLTGYVSFISTDEYSNESNKICDDDMVMVVDTISPTMEVEYSESSRMVDSQVYYNGDFTATFTITEANFDADDVIVTVSVDGEQAYEVYPSWTDESVDVHVGTITFADDADYIFKVTYTDKSTNKMTSYTSKTHTIDTVLPEIYVSYSSEVAPIDIIIDNDGNDRTYYDATQTATVTVVEHNFESSEVDFVIIGEDYISQNLDINSLISKSAWTTEGDTHTLIITYSGDANYSFDVNYTDLATNEAKDYDVDYFTVDKSAPTNLDISYSTSLLDTILESLTFGFYNAKMTVTITAQDTTSGIYEFLYSYLKADGVSEVNAQLIDELISAAQISYDGYTATASFEIPKMVLGDDNQFNGTVEFTASDRSDNETATIDSTRIVVDNIAPVIDVSLNDAINNIDDVSYYNGDINAAITIDEANFYADDVMVEISFIDDSSYYVTPSWTQLDADTYIGTFTISEDGDYFINISYTDKSNNEMQTYTSNQLTIDTVIESPFVTINDADANETAHKDEAILAFSCEDVNLLDYDYILTYTSLGSVDVDVTSDLVVDLDTFDANGGTITFEDFEKIAQNDGIYTLVVSMSDKSGHTSEITAMFTINRFGSVYEYSDDLLDLIANGGAYVQEVESDLIITEYNADRLVDGSLSIEITLDGKPIDSVEYSITPEMDADLSVSDSGWYEYQYTISSSNFKSDGIYKISVASQDATGNTPELNNYDDMNISFVVDTQAPEITSITGLEENIINLQETTVKYVVYDTSGIYSIEIFVDGEKLGDIINEFDDVNNFEGEFTLSENSAAQTVQIIVVDFAGNETNTSSEEFSSAYAFNSSVTISTNIFVRWYANQTLFWSSIGGGIFVVGLAIVLGFKFKKRRCK